MPADTCTPCLQASRCDLERSPVHTGHVVPFIVSLMKRKKFSTFLFFIKQSLVMKIQLTNVILVNKQYYLQKISTFDFVSMECKRSLKGPQRLNFWDLTFVIHVIWKVFKFCTTFILHAITNYLQVKSYKGKRGQNFKFSEDWHFDPYLSLSRDAQFTSWRFLQNFNVYILSFCVHF